jgi:hypothetical protein
VTAWSWATIFIARHRFSQPNAGIDRRKDAIAMNIRRIAPMLILPVLLVAAVAAADSDSTTTDGMFNGRMWQLLNRSQKEIHVTGIQEGVRLCLSHFKADMHISADLMRAMQAEGLFDRRRMLFTSLGVSAIVAGIDQFYAEAENLPFPIADAYQHVTLELNFAPRQELENNLLNLRRKYR